MAAAGTPVVAPYAGTISRTSFQSAGAGEYVVLDAADGRDYFFAHCLRRSTVVPEGAAVGAGQGLCQVGATGTTSGAPHLHFEIWHLGWRVRAAPRSTPCPSCSPGRVARPPTARRASDGVILRDRGEIAQLVEHTTENRGVPGSSPGLAMSGVLQCCGRRSRCPRQLPHRHPLVCTTTSYDKPTIRLATRRGEPSRARISPSSPTQEPRRRPRTRRARR